jgi:amino acid transporter
MYTMGRAGTLPASFGHIHPVHRTPTFAIAFVQVSGMAAILLVGFLLSPDIIFGFLGTITTLAVIILYVMANLALTNYMRREQQARFTLWQHAVIPWIATLALIPVLFVTVYPKPAWPYSLTPYLFLAGLVAGFAYMRWRESRNPGALQRGAMLLVPVVSAPERDVEPDNP